MNVTWTKTDGTHFTAQVREGQSLMEAAVANSIPEVMGECGGCLSCATCHVVVDPAWADKTGDVGEFEDAMLDATEVERTPTSRLSCQIIMAPSLDGLHLIVPKA